VCKTRRCNYSLEAPDDERCYLSKHAEQSRNNGIINCLTQLHLVGHFYKIFFAPSSETWSLTLSEERRLRVFENRVLRKVFGPKRDEVTGEWRKLHNEELNDCTPFPILCGW